MLLAHQVFGRRALSQELLIQPTQGRGHGRVLVAQTVNKLNQKGCRIGGLVIAGQYDLVGIGHHARGIEQLVR